MKLHQLSWLILVLLLAACTAAPAAELPVLTSTPPLPTPALLPATPSPAPTGPALAQTPLPQLDPQSTFAVIAAVRAYTLIVESWTTKDLSPAERQAVLYPLVEFGSHPLNSLPDLYRPDEDLADYWQQALEVNARFYRTSLAWTVAESPDEDFLPSLAADSAAIQEIIAQAVPVAENNRVDTDQYGPDYAGAIAAAAALLPEIAVQAPPEAPPPGELNPALLPVQITPFLFDFAGSDIFFTIGTIENTSAFPQQNVEIEVAYYNFLDEHIGTVRGRLLADVARPGGVYPFIAADVVAGEEAALHDWTRFEVSAFSFPIAAETYQEFLVEDLAAAINGNELVIEGQLTNTGAQTLNLAGIRIGVSAYDADGILVGVGDGAPIGEGTLAPNQSIPFEALIQSFSTPPASFQFFAESAGE